MSRLRNLLRQVEAKDPQLAADLEREVEALSGRRAFGLNFERHIPESVELPGRPVRRGDKVRFLAERGKKPSSVDRRLWRVAGVRRSEPGAVADLVRKSDSDGGSEITSRAVDDLVVVAEFRDPIYPGLVSTGRIEHGGDKPFHTVINGENFHALQALLYTHEGKVDAIYIDPPYNTGDPDWKYNNDYVDSEDAYRHSKWLAMMERRIKLAKQLLNPADSVLIVTIDEKEYLRLGLLLEQSFPEALRQMVTVVTNPSGTSRDSLSRVEEYAYFLFIGAARPCGLNDNFLTERGKLGANRELPWESLLRRGNAWYREARPNLCYPVLIDRKTQQIQGVGEPFAGDDEASRPTTISGFDAAWPVRTDGRLGIWRKDRRGLLGLIEKGYAYVSAPDERRGTWTIKYLMTGAIEAIDAGDAEVERAGKFGQIIGKLTEARTNPKTVWNRSRHNAGMHGSALLRLLIPGRHFPFPKSLYAVEDALRVAVSDKKNATVLDFFAGSGTTAHAVMRLNRQDGGHRNSISVTNNEVSAGEEKRLRAQGLRPGDPDWETLGIYEHITKPRITASVTGKTPEGKTIEGDYKFSDQFPMAEGFAENVEFFAMTYEAPRPLAHNRSFAAIAPLLWLKAGAEGRRIEHVVSDFGVADTYGILFDLDAAHDFVAAVAGAESVRMAFVVTDDDRGFQAVCGELPARVEAVRLYESYLTNFTINTGWE